MMVGGSERPTDDQDVVTHDKCPYTIGSAFKPGATHEYPSTAEWIQGMNCIALCSTAQQSGHLFHGWYNCC